MMRRIKYLFNKFLRALGKATGTSHQIALGVAIGFFVGWLPIVGIQMAVAIIVCQFAKANKIVPIFPIWLTNPATIIPVYSFNYWVGWKIVGGPPLSDLVAVLSRIVSHHEKTPDPGMGRLEFWWDGVSNALSQVLSMGWEMQLPLWLGCVIVGLALAVPSYYITNRVVGSFRKSVVVKKEERNTRIMTRRTNTRVDAAGRPMGGEPDEFGA